MPTTHYTTPSSKKKLTAPHPQILGNIKSTIYLSIPKIIIQLEGTPVLRTGQEVRNMAYRISETIEPKNLS